MSRRSKLAAFTDEDKARFLELLRIGTPMTWACRALRISTDTLANYRRRARMGEEPFSSFIRDVDKAQAEYVIRTLRILDADAVGAPLTDGRERGDNQALKWLLERLFPKDFGWRRVRHEHTGSYTGALGFSRSR